MRAPCTVLSLLGLSLVAVHASAEEDIATDPIVISATGVATPQSQIASSVTVITADEIALKQQRLLPDVLREVPGLNIVQTGGPGGLTAIFMRGTNSNHSKVYVDGIDVSDPSNANSGFDYAQLQAMDIEHIEVLRGPQSGLYGSDAVGGVIDITTRTGNGSLRTQGYLEGGSFDTFNQAANLSGSADQFHYSANVGHFHSGDAPVTPLDLLPPGEKRNDDYYDNITASTKLGYDVSSNLEFGFVARYTDTHLRLTGDDFSTFPSFPAAEQNAANTNEYYGRAFGHVVVLDGLLDQTLGIAYTRKRSADYQPELPVTLNTGERTRIDWRGKVRLSDTENLVLGAEHQRDDVSQPLSADVRVNSGYAELNSQLAENFFSALNVRYDNNSRFGSKVTYRLAPTYRIAEIGTKLMASVGTGFKAPTLSELYQSFPAFFFFANPNLKPETNIGYDVGFEKTLVDTVVTAGVTYFHNHLRDLIDTAPTGDTYANIGRAATQGVESFLEVHPIKTVSVRADYTYTQATDDILHQELLRRPKHKISVDAAWQATTALSVDANLVTVTSWVDGNRDFSIPRLDAPGYTTVNLSGNYDLSPNLTVFARVDNLFDRHYQNPTGYLQPSLGAFAGIKAKL
jgi:vitamin B12 transporter